MPQGFFYPEATVCAFMHAADSGMSVTSNSYYTDPWLFNCKNDPAQNSIFIAVDRCDLLQRRMPTVCGLCHRQGWCQLPIDAGSDCFRSPCPVLAG